VVGVVVGGVDGGVQRGGVILFWHDAVGVVMIVVGGIGSVREVR
jgi:hypothetical protein